MDLQRFEAAFLKELDKPDVWNLGTSRSPNELCLQHKRVDVRVEQHFYGPVEVLNRDGMGLLCLKSREAQEKVRDLRAQVMKRETQELATRVNEWVRTFPGF